MSWIPDSISKEVEDAKTKITYLPREVAKAWNGQRKVGESVVFTGWYWSKDSKEGGPFKSRSACVRDAYYIVVLHAAPPSPTAFQKRQEVAENRRQLREQNRTPRSSARRRVA